MVDWKKIKKGKECPPSCAMFQVGERSNSVRFAMCHNLQTFFKTSYLHTSSTPGFCSNRNEWFPTCSNYLMVLQLGTQCFAMSLWISKHVFFWNAGLAVSINLANSSLGFPICWLSWPELPGGAEGGDDGTSSPSKDASDDTRTCCLPTGANVLSCIWEGETVIYKLPETSMAPENRPSQRDTSIPTIHLQVLLGMLVLGRAYISM